MLIYFVRNKITGKGYVGLTVRTLAQRWKDHCKSSMARKGYLLSQAIQKYGVANFECIILHETEDRQELNRLEAQEIETRGTLSPNGYNLHTGGNSHQVSEETRAKLSIAAKNGKPRGGKGKKRRPHTLEEIAKISQSLKGNKYGNYIVNSPKEGCKRMKILDLFCCAGGASAGIHRAFPKAEIFGVDVNPQPHYPFTFVLGDWESVLPEGFDFIWASPPCQHYCALKTMPNRRPHPDLVAPVRRWLRKSGKPWVIENVFGAPLKNATMLCGSHFDLTAYGYQLRRHRYFEASFPIASPGGCRHAAKTQGVYGGKVRDIALEKRHYSKPKETRGKPVGVVLPQKYGFDAMQIDWMNIRELSECIPPAYSEYVLNQYKGSVGTQLYNSHKYRLGIPHTEDIKSKISASLKGRILGPSKLKGRKRPPRSLEWCARISMGKRFPNGRR